MKNQNNILTFGNKAVSSTTAVLIFSAPGTNDLQASDDLMFVQSSWIHLVTWLVRRITSSDNGRLLVWKILHTNHDKI